MFVSRDVTFREDVFPFNKDTESAAYLKPLPVSMPSSTSRDYDYEFDYDFGTVGTSHDDASQSDFPSQYDNPHVNSENSGEPDASENTSTSALSEVPVRRSTRIKKPSVWLHPYTSYLVKSEPSTMSAVIDQEVQPDSSCFMTSVTTTVDPTSYKQAVKFAHWVEAMNVELEALERNGTWMITTLPPGKVAIQCR